MMDVNGPFIAIGLAIGVAFCARAGILTPPSVTAPVASPSAPVRRTKPRRETLATLAMISGEHMSNLLLSETRYRPACDVWFGPE
jgi:hypothetical protein